MFEILLHIDLTCSLKSKEESRVTPRYLTLLDGVNVVVSTIIVVLSGIGLVEKMMN